MHRLITLAFSHYNEKARWALDRAGVTYVEHGYMPGFCSAAVAWESRGRGGHADRVSSRFSTPVLVVEPGEMLCDSTDIARYASVQLVQAGGPSLFPNGEVAQLVEHYGDRLGPYTRRAAYFHAFRHPGMLNDLAHRTVSPRQARWFVRLYPLLERGVGRALRIDQRSYERALATVRMELDAAAERLETRRYLAGDSFTAADLTFAALLAPALLVTEDEGYGSALPRVGELDAEGQALVREVRAHPAGRFALRMFDEERR